MVTGSTEMVPGRLSLLRDAEEAFLALLIAVIIRLFPCASFADDSILMMFQNPMQIIKLTRRWRKKSYGDDQLSIQMIKTLCR